MRIPNKELLSDGAVQKGISFFSIGPGKLKGSKLFEKNFAG